MSESQSRYGIMEELNNRKINQKEKLANLERDTDAHIYNKDLEVAEIAEDIKAKQKTYKIEFKQQMRQMQVNLDMINCDFTRAVKELTERMAEHESTYEQKFQDWKSENEKKSKIITTDLKRYITVQATKINDKTAIIDEIDNGIKSLKEMSAEQSSD